MKAVNIYSDVLGVALTKTHAVIFTRNQEANTETEHFLTVENLYTSVGSEIGVVYQIEKSKDVFLLDSSFQMKKITGNYSVLKSFEHEKGFVVVGLDSRTFQHLSPNSDEVIDLGFYYNYSSNVSKDILYKRLGDEIQIFSFSAKKILQSINVKLDYGIDASPKDDPFCFADKIIIPLKNGLMIAINLFTRDLMWHQSELGQSQLWQDKIYSVSPNGLSDIDLIEVNANSGEKLQARKMPNLDREFGFRPTGYHKVYDRYIFCMAARRPGLVAVFDRGTLEFIEMIQLEESIPIGVDHLHWQNGRLYVLDFGKTLHVFE